jgi:hypothetical protein
MLKILILSASLLLCNCSFAQDEPKTDSERQADSLLNKFFNDQEGDPRFTEGIDSARLEKADNDHMDDFLELERDLQKERVHKITLQVIIGLAMVSILFIVFRSNRRKNRRDRYLPRN